MQRVRHLLGGKAQEVWSVDAEEPVLEAIQIMADKHIGALPVTRNGELVGVFPSATTPARSILLGRSSAETPVWQIMSSPVITVSPNEDVRQCMQLMTEKRIRHLPVVAGRQHGGHDLDRRPRARRDRRAGPDDPAPGAVYRGLTRARRQSDQACCNSTAERQPAVALQLRPCVPFSVPCRLRWRSISAASNWPPPSCCSPAASASARNTPASMATRIVMPAPSC